MVMQSLVIEMMSISPGWPGLSVDHREYIKYEKVLYILLKANYQLVWKGEGEGYIPNGSLHTTDSDTGPGSL